MGLFGPSKAALADRIEELEDEQQEQRNYIKAVEEKAKTARARADHAEDKAEQLSKNAAHIATALSDLHLDAAEMEDKSAVVETLDEPHIGWKATNDSIVKLLIPEGARVVHPSTLDVNHGSKKRTDEAIPIAFYGVDEYRGVSGADRRQSKAKPHTGDRSKRNGFEYSIGEIARPTYALDESVMSECTSGIHFFCTEQEAVDWY